MVRTNSKNNIYRSWLSRRNFPVKKYNKQPIQLDLIEYINQKEKKMNDELKQKIEEQFNESVAQGAKPVSFNELKDNGGIVDVEFLAKKVEIHPYFTMDSVSGDMVSFFSSKNVKAAVRSFCNSLDPLPLSLVKDLILVDAETREIVFDGKDYVDEWKDHQQYRLEEMIRNFKGGK